MEPRYLYAAEDVTDRVLELAEEVYDGWFDGEDRINWEEFLDRLCRWGLLEPEPWEFEQYDTPAERKIRRHIKEYRSQ